MNFFLEWVTRLSAARPPQTADRGASHVGYGSNLDIASLVGAKFDPANPLAFLAPEPDLSVMCPIHVRRPHQSGEPFGVDSYLRERAFEFKVNLVGHGKIVDHLRFHAPLGALAWPMEFVAMLANFPHLARVLTRREHRDRVLRLRPIENVLEIEANRIIAEQACLRMRLEDQGIEAAPLTLLIGGIVVERSPKVGTQHVDRSLTEGGGGGQPQAQNKESVSEIRPSWCENDRALYRFAKSSAPIQSH